MSKQPNSTHCFVCGIENPIGLHLKFYEIEPGVVCSEITFPEQYQGYPGIVHGGIITSILDEAAGRSHMGGYPPRFMYTAKIEVRFRKNAPVGEPLRLVGKAGESKGRKASAHAALYNSAGELLADADALLIDVPEAVVGNVDLEEIGWKVYPDE